MLNPLAVCKSYLPLALMFLAAPLLGQIDVYSSVLTQHNNPQRTGVYDRETILTPDSIPINANSNHRFGVLVIRKVDDRVSAQPLYVSHVTIGGVSKNVLYVVTRNNTIYAFDADNGDKNDRNSGMVWPTSVTLKLTEPDPPKQTLFAAPLSDQNCHQTQGNIGILSTPVIDPASNRMYFVARFGHKDPSDHFFGTNVYHYLVSMDIRNGQELQRQRIEAPEFFGNAELNRPGLLLMNGVIYVGFGAPVCDASENAPNPPPPPPGIVVMRLIFQPHGFVFAYRAADLHQLGVYNTSPRSSLAGIWQSGAGLAGDPTHNLVFATTGNNGDSDFIHYCQTGTSDPLPPGLSCGGAIGSPPFDDLYHSSRTEVGESVLKLSLTSNSFKCVGGNNPCVTEHFTAGNWYRLDTGHFEPPRATYSDKDKPIRDACSVAFKSLPQNVQNGFKRGESDACDFAGDSDLGSGGPVVLSNGLVLSGGKQGLIYILDPDPDHFKHPRQTFQATWNSWHGGTGRSTCSLQVPPYQPGCVISSEDYDFNQAWGPNIHGAPVVWQRQNSDFGYVYVMGEKDYLRGYKIFKDGRVDTASALSGNPKVIFDPALRAAFGGGSGSPIFGHPAPSVQLRAPDGMPGGSLSLSSNGDNGAILWVSLSPKEDSTVGVHSGVLMAFDATTLHYLWSDPDPLISFAKFVPPTIAGGKVFRATFGDGYTDTACSPTNNASGSRGCGSIVIYGIQRRVQAKKFH